MCFFKDSAELPVFQVLVKNQGTSPTFQLIDTMTGLTDAGAAFYLRSADYFSANQQPGRLPLDGAILERSADQPSSEGEGLEEGAGGEEGGGGRGERGKKTPPLFIG